MSATFRASMLGNWTDVSSTSRVPGEKGFPGQARDRLDDPGALADRKQGAAQVGLTLRSLHNAPSIGLELPKTIQR